MSTRPTGEQTDANGLQYLRARYYNPDAGIFLGKDPVWGQSGVGMSMNGYSYVHGNPTNLVVGEYRSFGARTRLAPQSLQ